jgi:SulP family sulfate permease
VIFCGDRILTVLYLLPMSILGVLLIFAGGQLALTVIDLKDRKGLFVAVMMLGITLASNLAAGFLVGLVIAYLLKSEHLSV